MFCNLLKLGLITLLLPGLLIAAEEPLSASEFEGLSLSQVLVSTLNSHPAVFSALAKYQQAQGKRLSADGGFDWTLEYDQQNRIDGFYDGWFLDQKLSRQLGWANANISAGYRRSEGSLPIYEEYYRTLDEGEPNLSLSLSLLKYRVTDPFRQAVVQSELDLLAQAQSQVLTLNSLLSDAANHYLNWRLAYLETQVARDLLELALARNTAIEQKVQAGDVAEIIKIEFETALLNRRSALLASDQKLAAAAIKLSLYWRDSAGNPVMPARTQAPKQEQHLVNQVIKKLEGLPEMIPNHPELKSFLLRQQKLQANRRLTGSELLPALDFNVRIANDYGAGSGTLDGVESYVGLKFSLPLERRAARGKLAAIDAELKQLKFEQRETQELMSNYVDAGLLELKNMVQLLDIQHRQVALATNLAKLEQIRFENGDSDLFLLNAREQALAMSQLAAVRTEIGLQRKQIHLLASAALLPELVERL